MNVALAVGRRQRALQSRSQWWRRRRRRHGIPKSINRRSLAVMVVGHGWTGALGTGRLDQYVPGHEEDYHEDYDDDDSQINDANDDARSNYVDPNLPVTIYNGGPVRMARPGWGHTAVITHDDRLLLTGRPHDFQNLLRLHRMPEWMRYQIAKQLTTTSDSNSSGGGSYLDRLLSFLMENFGGAGPSTQANTGNKAGRCQHDNNKEASTDLMLTDWQAAANMSMLASLTEIPLPEPPLAVACSAGLTALVTKNPSTSTSDGGGGGNVYTFGINMFGQCGTGVVSNNIWQPTRVVTNHDSSLQLLDLLESGGTDEDDIGSSSDEKEDSIDSNSLATFDDNDDDEYYEQPFHDLKSIKSIALGLQHGVCLNDDGQVFCFGKGDRGQLGQGKFLPFTPMAELVEQYCVLVRPPDDSSVDSNENSYSYNPNPKPLYKPLGPVQQVAAGLLHTAALTKDDDDDDDHHPQVLLWGKNVLAPLIGDERDGKAASDANVPCQLHFPSCSKKVIDICCGSHHTAMLLEDGSVYGVGISSSATKVPIHEPVLMIPPGIVEMPVRQFAAHFDRTTIVGASGQQVLQVHLMEEPEDEDDLEAESSSNTFFTPAWLDRLLDHDPTIRIQEVHRGWLHTVIVTDDDGNDGDDTEEKNEDDSDDSNASSP